MGSDKRTKKKASVKAAQERRMARRIERRISESVPELGGLSNERLLHLIPRERVETILGTAVEWRVLRTRDEIRGECLSAYNTGIFFDLSLRYLPLTKDESHPLMRFPNLVWLNAPNFAETVSAPHNQAIVSGYVGDVECISLHISGIFPQTLFINDIELGNPNLPLARPMGPDQRLAGLGNGIFAEVIERLKVLGRELGFRAIRAHAVDRTRADIFRRKAGFTLDDIDRELLQASHFTGRQVPLLIALDET